jgi:uncharacterized protein (DUF983 family)
VSSGRPHRYRRFLDVAKMTRVTATGRCPACERASAFRGPYTLHATCPACGVRFERDPGSFLGALAVAYGLAVAILAVVATALLLRYGAFEGLALVLVAVAVAAVLLVYRPAKAWWTWWMWAAGFVYRDDDPPAARKG